MRGTQSRVGIRIDLRAPVRPTDFYFIFSSSLTIPTLLNPMDPKPGIVQLEEAKLASHRFGDEAHQQRLTRRILLKLDTRYPSLPSSSKKVVNTELGSCRCWRYSSSARSSIVRMSAMPRSLVWRVTWGLMTTSMTLDWRCFISFIFAGGHHQEDEQE